MPTKFAGLPRAARITGKQPKKTPRSYETHPHPKRTYGLSVRGATKKDMSYRA